MDGMDEGKQARPAEPLIPRHGGFRNLKSFQGAQLVYDATAAFCDAHIDRRSRTHDQMVQAARSGVQNIAEGSQASATSRKSEMQLTSVARASLEELRLDYEDYLRQRQLPQWDRMGARRTELIARRPASLEDVAHWVRWAEKNHGQDGPEPQNGQNGRDGRNGPSGQRQGTPSIQSPQFISGRPART